MGYYVGLNHCLLDAASTADKNANSSVGHDQILHDRRIGYILADDAVVLVSFYVILSYFRF